jgi:hypothetical protein
LRFQIEAVEHESENKGFQSRVSLAVHKPKPAWWIWICILQDFGTFRDQNFIRILDLDLTFFKEKTVEFTELRQFYRYIKVVQFVIIFTLHPLTSKFCCSPFFKTIVG